MTEVRFLPPAARFLKKCKDKKLKLLYRQAIDKIKEDHTIGEAKNGDLSGIYGYDIYDIEREDILKVVKELIKMCKED